MIDPCNHSGETVMGRRTVMRVDPLYLDASGTLIQGAQPERFATAIAVAETKPDRKPELC